MQKSNQEYSELINTIAELAREVGNEDPIDFASLDIDDESVYHLMASNVIEQYQNITDNQLVMLATITHLIVENFILNLKLRQ